MPGAVRAARGLHPSEPRGRVAGVSALIVAQTRRTWYLPSCVVLLLLLVVLSVVAVVYLTMLGNVKNYRIKNRDQSRIGSDARTIGTETINLREMLE